MSSAERTLELLTYFSVTRPEMGLSQLCRLAQRDKATTYRHLQVLEDAGFVEQDAETKRYRLGPAILQLAQTREQTVPRKAGAEAALSDLANATGETAHVSVLSGTTLYALASRESPHHSTRAIIDIQTFPLHATASGLCVLAFGPPGLMAVATANMKAFTQKTVTTADGLMNAVRSARQSGFGRSIRTYEEEICSLSVPVWDQTGRLAGAVSVASVATRFTSDLERLIQQHLVSASREISRNWGGTIPDHIEADWAKSLSQSQIPEPAS